MISMRFRRKSNRSQKNRPTTTRLFLGPKVSLAPQGGSGSKKDISNSYEISKVKLHFLGGEQKGNNSGGCKI